MTSRSRQSAPRRPQQQQQQKKETICERMAGFLKALGFENKSEYTDKIPETLTEDDFHLHKTFHHGFPSQPSCLAYDAVQKILAIATKHGTVLLLGKPGLEGTLTHPETCSVLQMEFIDNKSFLITSCDNRTLYQWSVAGKRPEIKHQLQFTKECPSTMSWTYGSKWLYVGNDAGNVHLVHVDSFTLSGYIIQWNCVVDGPHKMRPGDVMAVKEHPMDQGKVLIAYSSSLLVLWNIKNKCCDKRYTHDPGINHVLTCVSWLGSGKLFSSTYSDGTMAIWNPKVDNRPERVCHVHETETETRVSKIVYKLQVQMTESDPWYICSGGYPEESHSCPKTITIRHGKSLSLLSTNSTIVDFLSLPSSPFATDPQKPLALVILTKDELVVHDLQTENFPMFPLAHALDIHMPPVSCIECHGNCPEELIASLHSVKSKMPHQFNSSRQWPLMGGKWGQESPYLPTDLILTGHTDGSVRLWYCSSVIFQTFFTLPTTSFFKFNYAPISFPTPTNSPSPIKKHNPKLTSSPLSSPKHKYRNLEETKKVPPTRPPPPSRIDKSSSAPQMNNLVKEGERVEVGGRGVEGKSDQVVFSRRVSRESEQGGREGGDEEEEELERLKTPSPATGQLRVEGEESTDGQTSRIETHSSPASPRKTIYPREKKSIFKRRTSRAGVSDSPKLSPRHIPPDNISEMSDDRSESPALDEREKKIKGLKKLKSFRKVAMKVTRRKMVSKGSSSEEREDTDAASLGYSEGGEEEGEGEKGGIEGEIAEDGIVDHEEESNDGHSNGGSQAERNSIKSSPQRRPESLCAPPLTAANGEEENTRRGSKVKKGSKSFRQEKKDSLMTPNETPKRSFMRTFERRTSAPGNFKVSHGTPIVTTGRILGNDPPNEAPLTPIVEISPPNTEGTGSVFAMDEDIFAVQGIKCCMWGQWMCVSNAAGHVMAFSFQMDESVTTPKTIDVDFDRDTVLKCGELPTQTTDNLLRWALNERASENTPGFRLRQHVRCFSTSSLTGGERGGGGGCFNIPTSVHNVQYSVDIGLLAVGTNKGLAVIDTENNTVLHILSSLTSLLYMTNPSKFTRQVTRESTQINLQQSKPVIHRHSTSWTLPHTSSSMGLLQVNSPVKKLTNAPKTPPGKDGLMVGVADSTHQLGITDGDYRVMDCESSITALDIVQLPLDKHAPPTLTLWVGTASGHTVTYGITVKDMTSGDDGGWSKGGSGGKVTKRKIQLMPTGLISEHKHPIVTMQFLNEWGDRQVVPYRIAHNSSVRVDEGRRRSQVVSEPTTPTGSSNSKKENYIIIVDERKIKSYIFPGMTVINRATAPVENTTLLSSQYFLCKDLPCLLTLTSSHHVLIHSLPGLKHIIAQHYIPLINHRVMSTFRVSGDGQALFMPSESEMQRLCVPKKDRLNLPDCLPSFHVKVPDPQPVSKGKMDWLFGSCPTEMDRASVFGVNAGQPLISVAKRDGMSGAGSHQNASARSRRKGGDGERSGRSEGERRGSKESGEGGRDEDRGRWRGREDRLIEDKRQDGRERRRDAGGLSGQMNRNREALEQRKQALTELEQKTEQLAGDADDFATLAAKLANKNKMKSR